MKKYIILFTAMTCLFTAVQAQKITKIEAKNATGNWTWINIPADTIFFPASVKVSHFSMFYKFEYTNGNTPMEMGDTIFISGTFGGTVFNCLWDDITVSGITYLGHLQELKKPLSAGEKYTIDLQVEIGQQGGADAMSNYPSILASAMKVYGNDTIYELQLCGEVVYASKYNVNTNVSRLCYEPVYMTKAKPVVSIAESVMDKVQFFPNPVTNNLNITNLSSATNVSLYNIVGQRMVHHENVSGEMSIDMKEYPDGVYFVKIQNGKTIRTEKVKLVK